MILKNNNNMINDILNLQGIIIIHVSNDINIMSIVQFSLDYVNHYPFTIIIFSCIRILTGSRLVF